MNKFPYHIGRRVGYQGPRCPVGNQAGNVKYATGKQLRTRFSIGAWNVRKMKESGKLHTVCDKIDRIKLEILGISETNWTNRGSFRAEERMKDMDIAIGCSHFIKGISQVPYWV